MTEKEKDLLIKDLCARLSYGVRVFVSVDDFDNYQYPYLLTAISKFGQNSFCKIYSPIYTPLGCPGIENIKPYLFPLSSMTREQKQYLKNRFCYDWDDEPHDLWKCQIEIGDIDELIDWFNKNHFDYRCLIEKGLAIDATNLNIY